MLPIPDLYFLELDARLPAYSKCFKDGFFGSKGHCQIGHAVRVGISPLLLPRREYFVHKYLTACFQYISHSADGNNVYANAYWQLNPSQRWTLQNHRHEKVRIVLFTRVDDMLPLIAKLGWLDSRKRHRCEIVSCYDET